MEELKQDSHTKTKQKHLIDCQNKLKITKTTEGWLDNIEYIDTVGKEKSNMTHKKILQGILDKNKRIVVKISDKTEDIKKEYQVFTILHNNKIQGILHYYCYFECNGNINNFLPLCKGDGDNTRILLMEYIKNKNMAEHKWNDKSKILSCIKQIICTYLQAFIKTGFIHNDLHLKNVLIKNTKSKNIEYDINGKIINVSIPENGFKK